MQVARWLSTALFIVLVPVFLVLSNVRVATMEPRVYDYSFDHYDVSEVTRLDRTQLTGAARDFVHYFQDSRPLLTTRVVLGGQEQPLFSQKETLHMKDVKALFQAVFVVHEVALAYVLAYVGAVFVWSHERSMRTLANQLIRAGIGTVGALTVAALAMLVGFDQLFYLFHRLSFANDLWELNPLTDHLIQMFPRDFWFMVTIAIGVATIIEGSLLVLAGYALRTWFDRSTARPTQPELVEVAS